MEIEDIRQGNSTVWFFVSGVQFKQDIFLVIWIIIVCITFSFIIPLTISYSFYSITNHTQIRSESLHLILGALLLTILYIGLIVLEFEIIQNPTIVNNFDILILVGNIISAINFAFIMSLLITLALIILIRRRLLFGI